MSYGSSGRYREMEVMAMSPARRVVLLYTHLLVSLKQTRMHIERGEIEARTERILKAEEIIHELAVSLDHEQGGDLAARLASLYAWLLGQLGQLQLHPEIARLDSIFRVVSELHEAFDTAAGQLEAEPGLRAAS